jgi:hypothetical protein
VYAVLRSLGYLVFERGHALAVAGCVAVIVGYSVQDFRDQSDWARAADLQQPVLTAVAKAAPPDGSLVLTFGWPAQAAPGVPVFDQNYDLRPAVQLTINRQIETYPVFDGAQLRCSADGFRVDDLSTPQYVSINFEGLGKPYGYSHVVFVDVADGRHRVLHSRKGCLRALKDYPPGPLTAPDS